MGWQNEFIQVLIIHYINQKQELPKTEMKYYIDPIKANKGKDGRVKKNIYQQFKQDNQATHPYYSQLYYPNLKYFCQICKKDITNLTQVLIQQRDICVYCFSNMNQYPEYYYVIGKLNMSLTEHKWSALHDLLLLNTMIKWGFGSWEQVETVLYYFGMDIKAKDIQKHYQTYFLKNKDYRPELPMLMKEKQDINNKHQKQQSQSGYYQLYSRQSIQPYQYHALVANQPRIVGYNPKRDQFYSEYDHEAEKMLANLQFRADDTAEEIQIKFQLIENYNHRINERIKRKQFILEHRLLDEQYQQQVSLTRSKYQKQTALQLRPISRFNNLKDHNLLISKVALSNKLKSLIQGLRKCRRIDPQGTISSVYSYIKRKRQQSNSTNKLKPRKLIHLDLSNNEKLKEIKDRIKQDIGMGIEQLISIRDKAQQLKIGESIDIENCIVTLIKKQDRQQC